MKKEGRKEKNHQNNPHWKILVWVAVPVISEESSWSTDSEIISETLAHPPLPRHWETKRGRRGTRGDKATAASDLHFRGLSPWLSDFSRFFRGLRTASSQERLALLASQIPSRKNIHPLASPLSLVPIPSLFPLPSFSFPPPAFLRHVVVIVDVTISRPLFALFLPLSLGGGRYHRHGGRRETGMEKDSHPAPFLSRERSHLTVDE